MEAIKNCDTHQARATRRRAKNMKQRHSPNKNMPFTFWVWGYGRAAGEE